uniref:ribosomal protein L5 n=1 Tax=Hapterophycus canaliculatus TaxID=2567908 RepID=UPI002E79DAB9|nr:ribosomal protein L5 [Hapterophycus canaliculatus]WBP70159.1 ribosomal protein L5 [Hapterophycus canaliculatus]
MNSFQKHYLDVVQKDLILSENLSTIAKLSKPKKISLSLGGNSSDENYVLASLGALKIITGQSPFFTQQKPTKHKSNSTREGVGGKLTLRRQKMYLFLYKLLFDVLPQIRQFEGLRAPAHKNIHSFVLRDIFAFQELVPLFPYFEDLNSLQCQFHFTTKSKAEVVVLGNSLQLCFLKGEK